MKGQSFVRRRKNHRTPSFKAPKEKHAIAAIVKQMCVSGLVHTVFCFFSFEPLEVASTNACSPDGSAKNA